VGDVDGRHAEAVLQIDDLGAGLHAQLRVEVRQRLVHEIDRRLPHDRAAHRDALALAAGEVAGLASRYGSRSRMRAVSRTRDIRSSFGRPAA
jgi:hypothetical protein